MRATGLAPSPLFLMLVAASVAGGALAALGTGAARTAGIVTLVLDGWAVALCLHEFGHALTAHWGGDRSVRAKGYLTLDIRRYTDPVMSLLLPLALLALGGIPLPGGAVWINRAALRSRAVASAVTGGSDRWLPRAPVLALKELFSQPVKPLLVPTCSAPGYRRRQGTHRGAARTWGWV